MLNIYKRLVSADNSIVLKVSLYFQSNPLSLNPSLTQLRALSETKLYFKVFFNGVLELV